MCSESAISNVSPGVATTSADDGFHRSSQSGQTTVFLALAMMVLICFLAFMVDVGQLVHDKILTQSVADMVALSGGTVQAVGMNELADLNWEYRELQNDLRMWILFPHIDLSALQAQIRFFKLMMSKVYYEMQVVNRLTQASSVVSAWRVLQWHDDRYGDFQMAFVLPWPPLGLTELEHTDRVPLIGTYVQKTGTHPFPCFVPIPFRLIPIVPAITTGVPTGYFEMLEETYMRKADYADTTSFSVLVSRKSRPVFMNLASMGFDVEIPRLYAASGVIPTGGDIEKGRPEYFARFVPLEELGYPGFRH